MDFLGMKRKQLQALCKKHGIPANKTNHEMATLLASALEVSENEDDLPNKLKKVRFNSEIEMREYEPTNRKRRGDSHRRISNSRVRAGGDVESEKVMIQSKRKVGDDHGSTFSREELGKTEVVGKVTRSRARAMEKISIGANPIATEVSKGDAKHAKVPIVSKRKVRKHQDLTLLCEELEKNKTETVGRITRSKAQTGEKTSCQIGEKAMATEAENDLEKAVETELVGRITRLKVQTGEKTYCRIRKNAIATEAKNDLEKAVETEIVGRITRLKAQTVEKTSCQIGKKTIAIEAENEVEKTVESEAKVVKEESEGTVRKECSKVSSRNLNRGKSVVPQNDKVESNLLDDQKVEKKSRKRSRNVYLEVVAEAEPSIGSRKEIENGFLSNSTITDDSVAVKPVRRSTRLGFKNDQVELSIPDKIMEKQLQSGSEMQAVVEEVISTESISPVRKSLIEVIGLTMPEASRDKCYSSLSCNTVVLESFKKIVSKSNSRRKWRSSAEVFDGCFEEKGNINNARSLGENFSAPSLDFVVSSMDKEMGNTKKEPFITNRAAKVDEEIPKMEKEPSIINNNDNVEVADIEKSVLDGTVGVYVDDQFVEPLESSADFENDTLSEPKSADLQTTISDACCLPSKWSCANPSDFEGLEDGKGEEEMTTGKYMQHEHESPNLNVSAETDSDVAQKEASINMLGNDYNIFRDVHERLDGEEVCFISTEEEDHGRDPGSILTLSDNNEEYKQVPHSSSDNENELNDAITRGAYDKVLCPPNFGDCNTQKREEPEDNFDSTNRKTRLSEILTAARSPKLPSEKLHDHEEIMLVKRNSNICAVIDESSTKFPAAVINTITRSDVNFDPDEEQCEIQEEEFGRAMESETNDGRCGNKVAANVNSSADSSFPHAICKEDDVYEMEILETMIISTGCKSRATIEEVVNCKSMKELNADKYHPASGKPEERAPTFMVCNHSVHEEVALKLNKNADESLSEHLCQESGFAEEKSVGLILSNSKCVEQMDMLEEEETQHEFTPSKVDMLMHGIGDCVVEGEATEKQGSSPSGDTCKHGEEAEKETDKIIFSGLNMPQAQKEGISRLYSRLSDEVFLGEELSDTNTTDLGALSRFSNVFFKDVIVTSGVVDRSVDSETLISMDIKAIDSTENVGNLDGDFNSKGEDTCPKEDTPKVISKGNSISDSNILLTDTPGSVTVKPNDIAGSLGICGQTTFENTECCTTLAEKPSINRPVLTSSRKEAKQNSIEANEFASISFGNSEVDRYVTISELNLLSYHARENMIPDIGSCLIEGNRETLEDSLIRKDYEHSISVEANTPNVEKVDAEIVEKQLDKAIDTVVDEPVHVGVEMSNGLCNISSFEQEFIEYENHKNKIVGIEHPSSTNEGMLVEEAPLDSWHPCLPIANEDLKDASDASDQENNIEDLEEVAEQEINEHYDEEVNEEDLVSDVDISAPREVSNVLHATAALDLKDLSLIPLFKGEEPEEVENLDAQVLQLNLINKDLTREQENAKMAKKCEDQVSEDQYDGYVHLMEEGVTELEYTPHVILDKSTDEGSSMQDNMTIKVDEIQGFSDLDSSKDESKMECYPINFKHNDIACRPFDLREATVLSKDVPKPDATIVDQSALLTTSPIGQGFSPKDNDQRTETKLLAPQLVRFLARKVGSLSVPSKQLSSSVLNKKQERTVFIHGTARRVQNLKGVKEKTGPKIAEKQHIVVPSHHGEGHEEVKNFLIIEQAEAQNPKEQSGDYVCKVENSDEPSFEVPSSSIQDNVPVMVDENQGYSDLDNHKDESVKVDYYHTNVKHVAIASQVVDVREEMTLIEDVPEVDALMVDQSAAFTNSAIGRGFGPEDSDLRRQTELLSSQMISSPAREEGIPSVPGEEHEEVKNSLITEQAEVQDPNDQHGEYVIKVENTGEPDFEVSSIQDNVPIKVDEKQGSSDPENHEDEPVKSDYHQTNVKHVDIACPVVDMREDMVLSEDVLEVDASMADQPAAFTNSTVGQETEDNYSDQRSKRKLLSPQTTISLAKPKNWKNQRTVLIHGTPQRVQDLHEMKENVPGTKLAQLGNVTAQKPSSKRRPLGDLRKN